MFRTLVLGAVALAAAGAGTAATYKIDPNHTSALFEVDHNGTSTNRGRFAGKEGSVEFDRAAKTGKADVTLDIASLVTGVPAFNKHLLGADFFNVEQHPSARFVAERFVFDGERVSEVVGALTLLGQTHPVTLKATKFNCYEHRTLKREVCGGDFETTIARSQWGMNWGLNFGAPDKVRLLVQIEAVHQP